MGDSGNADRVIVSYLTLRRLVGVLGVLLPVVLAVGWFVLSRSVELEWSISHYSLPGCRTSSWACSS